MAPKEMKKFTRTIFVAVKIIGFYKTITKNLVKSGKIVHRRLSGRFFSPVFFQVNLFSVIMDIWVGWETEGKPPIGGFCTHFAIFFCSSIFPSPDFTVTITAALPISFCFALNHFSSIYSIKNFTSKEEIFLKDVCIQFRPLFKSLIGQKTLGAGFF